MKIKRYLAATMREAIAQVREEQGPDAVILTNRRTAEGMEIIAAVDYDEALMAQAATQIMPKISKPAAPVSSPAPSTPSPATAGEDGGEGPKSLSPAPAAEARREGLTHPAAQIIWSQDPAIARMREEMHAMRELLESQLAGLAWNDMGRREPLRAKVLRDLSSLDIAPDIARQIVADMPAINTLDDSWKVPMGLLVRRIPVVDDGTLEQGGIVAVVGPTGVGKTTTIAKLAARFALQHGAHNLALISTDTYRIGAREQLHTYARILGVPMQIVQGRRELSIVLETLSNRKLVLIDTAGMSQRDHKLSEQFATLQSDRHRLRILLALSAASDAAALEETVRAFHRASPMGCVLTKLDEAASLGAPLSTVIRHKLPIAHICDGQRVPEDLHAADGRRAWLVQSAMKLRRQTGRVADEGFLADNFGRVAAHA